MPVPNVTAGQPITEAWGDAVADSVAALELAGPAHEAAVNPHPNYATDTDLANHAASSDPHSVYAKDADLAAHAAAADPHTGYVTDAGLTSHEGAADPHAGYQRETEKGSASGYAPLDSASKVPAANLPGGGALIQTINAVIDGAGAVIAVGRQLDLTVDYAGVITKWTVLADQSGSITVNVWKAAYSSFPPTSGGLLGSPAIAGAAKAQSGAISWSVAAGDVLRLNVAASATIQRVTVALTLTRTA